MTLSIIKLPFFDVRIMPKPAFGDLTDKKPDLPPWEVLAPHRDKLDELVENAKQLDNFRIK